jgi:predicted small metal-binding protein
MKEFQCKDIYPDCDYSTQAETEGETLAQAALHGQEKHGIQKFSDDLIARVRSFIRDKKEAA